MVTEAEGPVDEVEEPDQPRQPSDELKVVILLKSGRAMVGIQSPNCDPVFSTFEGDLDAALSQVPALVESAKAQWDAHPRYPKANLPEPPPSPTPAQPASRRSQPSFF